MHKSKKLKRSNKRLTKKRNKLVGGGNNAALKLKAMQALGIKPGAKTTFNEDMQIIKKKEELRTGKQFIIAKTPPINYVTQSYPQRQPMTEEAFTSDQSQYRSNSGKTYADYLKTFKENQETQKTSLAIATTATAPALRPSLAAQSRWQRFSKGVSNGVRGFTKTLNPFKSKSLSNIPKTGKH